MGLGFWFAGLGFRGRCCFVLFGGMEGGGSGLDRGIMHHRDGMNNFEHVWCQSKMRQVQ